MVRSFEDLPEETEDDLEVPDARFVITDTLLIFDNVAQTIKIVSNAHVKNDNIEESYNNAIKNIEAIEEKLRTNLPMHLLDEDLESLSNTTNIESNFKKEHFLDAVQKVKDYILEGDVIQVVLAQRLEFNISKDPFGNLSSVKIHQPFSLYVLFKIW